VLGFPTRHAKSSLHYNHRDRYHRGEGSPRAPRRKIAALRGLCGVYLCGKDDFAGVLQASLILNPRSPNTFNYTLIYICICKKNAVSVKR
jgi:hypothetical protein